MDIFQIIREGGFIMIPLLLFSILIWAVSFEKLWFLYHFNLQYKRLSLTAVDLIQDKKFNEAKGLCHNVHPLISRPYLVIFEPGTDLLAWEGQMERRLKETQLGLRRFLWILGTIGASAPFVGLFGTVVGIIKSFESIAATGKSGFAVVAAGLSEALIATAAGILVAVMAVIFYNYFQNRLATLTLQFKNSLEDLRELI
jgi:biopolymer transport protein ExbB/TolQ